jgi:hypothetical protein
MSRTSDHDSFSPAGKESRASKILKRLGISGKSVTIPTGKKGIPPSGETLHRSSLDGHLVSRVKVKRLDVIRAVNEVKHARSVSEVVSSTSRAKRILELYRRTHNPECRPPSSSDHIKK